MFLNYFYILYNESVMVFLNLMTENNKRRPITCDVEDIISNLPEHLIDSIVERLPLQDAMPIEGFAPEKRLNFSRMLSYLHNIELLNTDGYFLKTLITERNLRLLPHLFNRLKHSKIQNFKYGNLDKLCGALSLLQNSSNLETLWGSKAIHVDMEPTSNYLESSGCLGKALDRLKTIEIVSVEGSRPELLFIKILLDHSLSLKKMIIRPRTTDDPHKMLKIARNVMQFPRASTKAKILCLDPKPPNDIFK
ncbi:hypothetical protein Tco_0217697 [Tanacetum coccineum]